ncbi:hypothetical protein C0993_007422 [Termitomyces sp. T159_Od127]|nr:hypothetical protein C0993_007422 [Termitomyces sp. T159_Od127]
MMCMPEFVREFVGNHIKSKKLLHAQKAATLSTEVSKNLIKQKSEFLPQGKESRDIMTLLVHANASEKENARLSDEEMLAADLESMPYLNAVLKETLRYHPVIISLMRQAAKNHIIPLSRPVTTTSGDVITELPVEKGQMVITPISAYNRGVL